MYRSIIAKSIKHLAYTAFIALVYILQATVFVHLPILGEKPLLLPLAVTAIAVTEGAELGAVYGLIAGLLCDVALNQATVAFTVSLTVIGALIGWLSQRFLEEGILSCLLCALGTLCLSAFVGMFTLLVYRHESVPALLLTATVQTLYSLPFVVPMYYLCRVIRGIPERYFS